MRGRSVRTIVTILEVLAVGAAFSCDTGPSRPSPPPGDTEVCGAGGDTDPDGQPIGGGYGYSEIVDPADPRVVAVVSGAEDLKRELEAANPGDVVYVADDAVIELFASRPVVPLPIVISSDRVLLAGGRGRTAETEGALIRNKEPIPSGVGIRGSILWVVGNEVRITGLRIEGPSITADDRYDIWAGIGAGCVEALEVDNCELFGWTHAGVSLNRSGGHVHHNHIHDNLRVELGYGVSLANGSYAAIKANRFDHNRHHISGLGDGLPGALDSYEASYNVVGRFGESHGFDMHAGEGDIQVHAGHDIYIHHNTFTHADYNAIRIRGIPERLCRVECNEFLRYENEENAVRQTRHFGNLRIAHNCYMHNTRGLYALWRASGDWYRIATTDVMTGDLAVGDFDGDGQEDLLKIEGGQAWITSMHYTLYVGGGILWSPSLLSQQWDPYLTTELTLKDLALGDFDGDHSTDLLSQQADGYFYVSFGTGGGATGPWVQYAESRGSAANALGIGDFNGDGKADIFRTQEEGGRNAWYVAYGVDQGNVEDGPVEWTCLNRLDRYQTPLALGTFVGNDNVTDVFTADGRRWLISEGGGSAWRTYAMSSLTMNRLAFEDFGDGQGGEADGITDVFAACVGTWRVRYGRGDGPSEEWRAMAVSDKTVDDLLFGDFDGDGWTDMITSMTMTGR